jgi:hypothetical protein
MNGSGSKSFGVRMPLEMYLKMVEVCSKNGVTQTDLVLYALNRVGLFSDDDFKLGGGVLNQENEWLHQIELRNDEISELKAQLSELNIQLGDVKHRKEQAEIIAKKWYNLMEQCRKQGVDINDLTEYYKERNEEL